MTETELNTLFAAAYKAQRENRLPEALNLYKTLLESAPQHAQALHFIGLCHAQLGNMETAIDFLEQALKHAPEEASLHNNLANAYKKNQKIPEAIKHYKKAIQLSPDYAQAHHNLATVYAAQNEYKQALAHYSLAVHAAPDFTAAHFNLGLLLLKNNELTAAKTQFNNVLTLAPNHSDALFYLGVLHLEANQLDEAERAFHAVIQQDNTQQIQALTNLGVIALKRELGQLAIDYFTKALTLDNEHIEARNNLAATFMHYDRFENALMHYDVLLQQDPQNIEYLYNSGVAQMALGHLNEAINHFEQLLTLDHQHFATLNNLAAIYIRLEDREKAQLLLERAVAANPHDQSSQHMLHALAKDEETPLTRPEYANNLFNNYALYYDQHMQSQLKYSLPQHISQLLHKFHPQPAAQVLDLGCGTGLSGMVLRENSHYLIGVDIAAKMLAQAKEKELYDELVESELVNFLQQSKAIYDLVVAADVLPYLGDLEPLFAALSQKLKPQAQFIFSTEISEDKAWQLQNSARFSHLPDYIKALCEKYHLQLLAKEKVIARQQNGEGLAVMLYVAQSTKDELSAQP